MNKKILLLLIIFSTLLFNQCSKKMVNGKKELIEIIKTVNSPDSNIIVNIILFDGKVFYEINYKNKPLINRSKLGFLFKNAFPLNENFSISNVEYNQFDETWTQPWGEVKNIRNNYREMKIELQETKDLKRELIIVFRAFNDGVGFRYEFPEQENIKDFEIMDELTEFVFSDDHSAWWIPAYRDNRYEYLFKKSKFSKIDTVHTPLTIETTNGLYLCVHEANLTDYSSMTLASGENNTLQCDLVPWSDGVKVKASVPHKTPWRTIQIAEKPGDLITSYLVLNLNEPNKLEDVSWIKPAKYIGIWWGMHIGTQTWGSGDKHGATTQNAKEYIDFAAKHNFPGLLIEGWNVDWDGTWWDNGDIFKFTETHPDFDMEEVSKYAADKGVKIIGHHETGANIDNYEAQVEDAFAYYKKYGINTIKTGYVGIRANKTEWHHGQYMVRHYRKIVELAAKNKIMLDVHEPIKDTGIRRTYPNMMSREGARGCEYDAWASDGGNPPDYTTIIPFTRLLSGPFDFTPGIFNIFLGEQKPDNRANTTLAKQLAHYVVIYSPLQMAADLPENFEGNPAFKFIKDVPADWQDTKVIHAKIGDYITIARQDRNSEEWYIGSVTDENFRELEMDLSFLDKNKLYIAEIYADGPKADWENNPLDINIVKCFVNFETLLKLKLAAGGGQAIRIRKVNKNDNLGSIPNYEDIK